MIINKYIKKSNIYYIKYMDYNLDDKINLLYDFVYNQNSKNCFSIDKIALGKININDIKLSIPEPNETEYLQQYEMEKNNILTGKFQLLSFDETTNQIYLKKFSNQFPITVKINLYNNNVIINSLTNSINNESLFSYLLSQLILFKKTKHVILPLTNIDINISELDKIIPSDIFTKINSLINNNKIQEVCCLQLREHFFSSSTLHDYLLKNKCIYKGLLFQIVHTLAIIQNEFEGFRHNNLLLKNIFVYLKKSTNSITEYDGFKNDKFYLPNFGFDIKITNFENASIPKYYDSNKTPKNNYYDLYTFMNDLVSFKTINDCDKDTSLFFDKHLPKEIRNNFKNKELISPRDLLYDKYFDEFKNKPTHNHTSINNHEYKGKKYKIIETYMNSDNYSVLGNQLKLNSFSFKGIRSIKHNNKDRKKIIRKQELIQEQKQELIGGFPSLESVAYNKEKNDPNIPNDERDVMKKRRNENPVREPPVLLEQKIYDTSQKTQQRKDDIPPPYIPIYDPTSNDVSFHMLPYTQMQNPQPIQKVYNISLTNPIGSHSTINRIYEDMLPGEPKIYSALTLFERGQLINFIKNIIIQNHDGEDMNITGGEESILSFVKVLDPNPYAIGHNPYHDLARDFLLYRAAYPIRYNNKTNIEIAKQSMGMNVRMYKLTFGAIRAKTIAKGIDDDSFDVWREVKYYNWIRDYIIKNKISPNFVSPYLYKIDTKSNINWEEIEKIKDKIQTKGETNQIILNLQKINQFHDLKQVLSELSLLSQRNVSTVYDDPLQLFNPQTRIGTKEQYKLELSKIEDEYIKNYLSIYENFKGGVLEHKIREIEKIKQDNILYLKDKYKRLNIDIDDIKEDITQNSGKTLILLTESPTTNIIKWSGPVYDRVGIVRRMTSTGYHTPDVWRAMIFQLTYACAVLQKSKIYIDNFSLRNNIYIKDIFNDYNSIGSWIYKVNNVEYFIPNHGYILMIDSKYADIDTTPDFDTKPQTEPLFKMYGKIYTNNSIYHDSGLLNEKLVEQFRNVINPEKYRHNLKLEGGGCPDEEILTLLKNIYNEIDNDTIISDLIPKFFGEFVHNRVGSLLSRYEKENINKLSRPNFKKGNLLVYQKRYEEYEWVIFISDHKSDSNKKQILVKESDRYIIKEIHYAGRLFGYPENEKILQEPKKNMKYDESNIYETYNLDNII